MEQTSVADFGSIDPGLTEVQRKRSTTRKVSVAGSIIGLTTMMIQTIFTTYELLTVSLRGEEYLKLALLALLMMVVASFIVGFGWIVTFTLDLITCIRANSRTPQVQSDERIEAKLPTLTLLVANSVVGLPILTIYVAWLLEGSSESIVTSLLAVCDLAEVVIAVGLVFLLRMSKVLNSVAEASRAQGTQPV